MSRKKEMFTGSNSEKLPRKKEAASTSEHLESNAIFLNLSASELVEHVLENGEGTMVSLSENGSGPIRVITDKRGRSPKDKFIVKDGESDELVDWSENKPFAPEDYQKLRMKVIENLRSGRVYAQDLFVVADKNLRVRVRLFTKYAWQALFANNLFIRPTREELSKFEPELTIFDAADFQADPTKDGTRTGTFIIPNMSEGEVIIGGTQYAGEIKKSIFTMLNYYLPLKGVLPMHCSANYGEDGSSAVFFGLSGTGKTTLSADISRTLVGDDEHGWGPNGIFNFEGGCYAKVIGLRESTEPAIYQATRQFGTVLENIVIDSGTGEIDYDSDVLTENTRAAYPIEYIANADPEGTAGHPKHVIFLTCDATGVLPPVSRLGENQIAYHFLSGYTAKVAGTESGVTEPQPTFSPCFGGPFLPLPPKVYAEMLVNKVSEHGAKVWLVNTGWTGGPYGEGKRMAIPDTRAIVSAILNDQLDGVELKDSQIMELQIPAECPGVQSSILNPRNTWTDKDAYDQAARKLEQQFEANYKKYQ